MFSGWVSVTLHLPMRKCEQLVLTPNLALATIKSRELVDPTSRLIVHAGCRFPIH